MKFETLSCTNNTLMLNTLNKLIINSAPLNANFILITDEHKYLYNFFSVLNNKLYFEFYNKFYSYIEEYLQTDINIAFAHNSALFKLDKNDICCVYTLFSLNSFLTSSSISKTYDFSYISRHDYILKFTKYLQNFFIFYYDKTYSEQLPLEESLVRFCTALEKNKITITKNEINAKNKTNKYYSIGITSTYHRLIEKCNVSTKPYKPILIGNKYYLKGSTFINVFSLCRSNSYSDKSIRFYKLDYLEKLCTIKSQICKKDYLRILNIYENHYKFTLKNLPNQINSLGSRITKLSVKSKEKKVCIKNEYEQNYNVQIQNIFDKYVGINDDENVVCQVYSFILCKMLESQINLDTNQKIFTKSVLTNEQKTVVNLLFKKEYVRFFKKTPLNKNKIYNKLKSFCTKIKKKILNFDPIAANSLLSNTLVTYEKSTTTNNLALVLDKNKTILKQILFKYDKLKPSPTWLKHEYEAMEKENKKIQNLKIKLAELYFLYNFYAIEVYNIFEKDIYLPFYFDFRGRNYSDSCVGITNFTPSRYFMNYGSYEHTVDIKHNSNTNFIIDTFKKFIEQAKITFNIKKTDYFIDESVFYLLIGLGKEFLVKNKDIYKIEEILQAGVNALTYKDDMNLDKQIAMSHYKTCFFSLNDEIILKRFVSKDATASFIQNLIRFLGAKNLNSLLRANLFSLTEWSDTYVFCINEWRKTLIIENGRIIITKLIKDTKITFLIETSALKFFTRKTIKNTVMTSAYDSSFLTRWNSFKAGVIGDFPDFELNYDSSSENYKHLLALFQNFNTFLENDFVDKIYLSNPVKSLKQWLLNKLEKNPAKTKLDTDLKVEKSALIKTDIAECDLIYYKPNLCKKELNWTSKKDRVKYRAKKTFYRNLPLDVDFEKTEQAAKANIVHVGDGYYIMQINNNKKVLIPWWSVHDCVLIDLLNVGFFIDIANFEFKNFKYITICTDVETLKLFDEVNSLFIFI